MCACCPSEEEVGALLAPLGFRLTFQLEESLCEYIPGASLPAQYHFTAAGNAEVIYLAGKDTDPDGRPLPPHASRFWVYPGADALRYQQAVEALQTNWAMTWLEDGEPALERSA